MTDDRIVARLRTFVLTDKGRAVLFSADTCSCDMKYDPPVLSCHKCGTVYALASQLMMAIDGPRSDKSRRDWKLS